jgi:putative membrane protein
MDGGLGMGFGMGFGGLFMIIFWVLVIIGGIYFLKLIINPGDRKHTETAQDILKKRYASGEISKEEFDAKKRELT